MAYAPSNLYEALGVPIQPRPATFVPESTEETDSRIKELLSSMLDLSRNPDPVPLGKRIGTSIADAMGAYAAGIGRNPALATNFTDTMRALRERRNVRAQATLRDELDALQRSKERVEARNFRGQEIAKQAEQDAEAANVARGWRRGDQLLGQQFAKEQAAAEAAARAEELKAGRKWEETLLARQERKQIAREKAANDAEEQRRIDQEENEYNEKLGSALGIAEGLIQEVEQAGADPKTIDQRRRTLRLVTAIYGPDAMKAALEEFDAAFVQNRTPPKPVDPNAPTGIGDRAIVGIGKGLFEGAKGGPSLLDYLKGRK